MPESNKILIVDDHPTNVALLEDILGEDYSLATATSGKEALALALVFLPGLILLDIMMPGLDGYETCRRLRAHPALCHTKIIMVSAKAMVAERLQGYEAGADDYVTKPFDEDELLAKVRVYLRLKTVEEVDQLKSDLLTLLTHETRTPLNGILPPLEMLRTDADMEPGERQMWVETAYQSGLRLQRLFEKGMTLSAMKSGQWSFQFAPGDLCVIVRGAIDAVASYAVTQNVHIEQELPAMAPMVLDQAQIHSAVMAIMENAIQFSPGEGQVYVRVVCDTESASVIVTDHGDGVAPEVLPQVFEEFTHGDIAHHSAGHGLSLAITRQIVLAHHGTLGVESSQGAGTSVMIQLPIETPAAHACDIVLPLGHVL